MNTKKVALIFSTLIVLAVSQTALTQSEPPARTLVGAWIATLTPRNCDTGIPIPAGIAPVLFTIHADGTMSSWSQNNVITVTRSTFHGVWKREHGYNEYSTKYVGLQYNLTTGAFQARQEAAGKWTLSESGDEFTTDSRTTVYRTDGTSVTGCSTMAGTRIELDQ